jgi:4-oxalocrotonate tautomerase
MDGSTDAGASRLGPSFPSSPGPARQPEEAEEMPIIDVKVIEDVLTDDEKTAIAQGVTEAFIKVAGEAARPVTWVVIQDVPSGQWTMGGNPVTTAGVREMLGRVPASV